MQRLLTIDNLKYTLKDCKEQTYGTFGIPLGLFRLRTIITEYIDIKETKLSYIKDRRYRLIYQPAQNSVGAEIRYINKLRRIRMYK